MNDNCSSPTWPAVPANEVDADGDGHPLCGDCNDANATVYPGAPQLCDGINNDCSAPGWPAVPANEVDADGDGFRACGDCNDANATVYPGAPQICDGLNNNCSSSGWPGLVGTNERDDDADGLSECQGDCDDVAPWTYPGAPQICDGVNNDCLAPGWPSLAGTNEGDDDSDSFTECQGDCDDLHAAIRPGAIQLCDGLNNDCLAPGWPSLAGTNEADDDSDGLSECQGDCDDADSNTHPGAVETNDGRDNQCPSEPGRGLTDEISGSVAFANPSDRDEISWPAQPAATLYEVIQSGSPAFPGGCGDHIASTPSWSDGAVPAPGGALFYLVRSIAPNLGSWGARSTGAERSGFCGAESNCNDGTDNDADGLADCDDPDCFPSDSCAPATFTFVDTTGDDIAPAAFSDFLSAHGAGSADYIFFSLSGPGLPDFSWCSERADFYRENYLALAVSGGTVSSGSWNRWTLQEGGAWTGPDTTGHENFYGADCLENHAWCAEFGLGDRFLTVFPDQVNECETADYAVGCGSGSWVLTVKIGPRRLSTCGF